MTDTLYAAHTPASQDTDDGTARQLGMRYTAQFDGQVTGGRYWVPSDGLPPTVALWQLWEITGATSGDLLAEVDLSTLPSPTPDTWMAVPLGSPVAQSSSTEYLVCFYTNGGSFVFTSPSGGVLPLTSSPDSLMVADMAIFANGGASDTFPLSGDAGDDGVIDALFFVDVDFDEVSDREGSASFGVGLDLAASGSREPVGAGTFAVGLDLAATGVREPVGAGALGIGFTLQATGTSGEGRPVEPFPFAPGAVDTFPFGPRAVDTFPFGPRAVRSFEEVS